MMSGDIDRILLVEDNPADARLFREFLKETILANACLTHVNRLADALERLGEERFDVILLDLSLPDEEGLTTVVRTYARAPSVPIIVLTGLADQGLAVEAVRRGAQDYLVKSEVNGELLARAIHYAVERKRLEDQLSRSQKLESLGLVAGGIAHDFNNLLTGIMGNASLALETLPPSDPARELLEDVLYASERAADLTRQLVAYSGKGRFVIRTIDLSNLVREISKLIETSISKQVKLRFHLAADLPAVKVDPSQIQQLIMNLIINAGEAIGDRTGTVMVRTGVEQLDGASVQAILGQDEISPGRYVYLEVEDTGCGMDEETKAHMFDPFFTTKFMGRGLGLAAALGIVRGHRGAIRIQTSPGKGSTFRVLLPATDDQLTEEAPASEHEDLSGEGTVLVIDDTEFVRRTASAALGKYGYAVLLALNGQEALEVFRQAADRISAVLLDLTMPVMSGRETLENLRRIRPDIPVIISSGYDEEEACRRFAGSVEAAFIQKPYTSTQLARKVKSVLNS